MSKFRSSDCNRLVIFGSFLVALLVGAQALRIVPLWWDEAWTATVAKNLFEQGYPGVHLDGKRVGWVFSAPVPSVLLSYLGFLLFGVGVVQARFFFFIVSLLFLITFQKLITKIWSLRIAAYSMVLLLVSGSGVYFIPTVQGAEVMTEVPTLLALCLGWILLCNFQRFGYLSIFGAGLMWGLAILFKFQLAYFLIASVSITTLRLLFMKRFQVCLHLCGTTILAYAFSKYPWNYYLDCIISSLTKLPVELAITLPESYKSDIFRVLALNFHADVRIAALSVALYSAPAYLLGLVCWLYNLKKPNVRTTFESSSHVLAVKYTFQSLAILWLLWFLFCSIGFPRYLFISIVLLAPFAAEQIVIWVGEVGLDDRLRDIWSNVSSKRMNPRVLSELLLVLAGFFLICSTAFACVVYLSILPQENARKVAEYLDARMTNDEFVETEEVELFFFLKHRYQYAPMEVHNLMNLNRYTEGAVDIGYDPLSKKPGFIVVGPFNYIYKVYDEAIKKGGYLEIEKIGPYSIYVPPESNMRLTDN